MTNSYEVLTVYKHTTIGTSGYMQCNLSQVDMVADIYNGFLMHSKYSNEAIIYKTISNKGITTTDSYEGYECESYYVEDAKEVAREYGLNNSDFVVSIVFNDDKSLMNVTYGDRNVYVINTSDMTVSYSYKCKSSVEYMFYYCGMDSEGNTYWASDNYGYGVSPEGNLISIICRLRVVRDDKAYMGYKVSDEFSVAPIYSTKDLIEKAEEYLELDKTEE